ncbi:hypothetical protein [Streptomyces bambusae]|uniref:Uncharacterized protein n=1 Tax=Streptomyces bambusae TaxID=1550616 RepID=A0ABS6Z4D8_9ACTN|nr:hypothetical protein [Streptomyces bambusae]MBW5482614.1 hypothetical protein [Streptomyces bambusae]
MSHSLGSAGGSENGNPAHGGSGAQAPSSAVPGGHSAPTQTPLPPPGTSATPPSATSPTPTPASAPASASTPPGPSAGSPATPTGGSGTQPTTTSTPPAPGGDAESRWSHKANIIGLLTLVAAVVGIGITVYYSNDSSESGRSQAKSGDVQASTGASEAARQPRLKVSRVAAYIKAGIEGKEETSEGEEPLSSLRGPHIDITFENRAPGPSLITKATLRLREAGSLPSCHQIGGDLAISMNYDFPLPADLPKMPYEQTKDISFTVEDNKIDRLTLTVGPKNHGWTNPWYGVADIVFEHDGTKTTVGPIVVVDAGGDADFYPEDDTWVINNISRPACLDENAALVNRLMAIPGVTVSKEVKSLREKLTSMGH